MKARDRHDFLCWLGNLGKLLKMHIFPTLKDLLKGYISCRFVFFHFLSTVPTIKLAIFPQFSLLSHLMKLLLQCQSSPASSSLLFPHILYIPYCWHVGKKHHLRVNEDMLTGFCQTQWKETEFPPSSCGGRSLSPLQAVYLVTGLIGACCLWDSPLPTIIHSWKTPAIQNIKPSCTISQSPSIQKISFNK